MSVIGHGAKDILFCFITVKQFLPSTCSCSRLGRKHNPLPSLVTAYFCLDAFGPRALRTMVSDSLYSMLFCLVLQIGTFTLFQETYHRPTFKQMHISGPKSDFEHRLLTQDRAMRAGIDDVGIGTLFGLYDYRYEVLAMLMHANHLEENYGAGPHTISVPRMRPAEGSELSIKPPYEVDDDNFKKLVATIRIAVPYTGMILSTRESPEMRDELLKVGMSQMSAGSRTDVGAYHRDDNAATEEHLGELSGQFSLMDNRTASEVVKDLMAKGYVPSWCTACYRKGRTGEHFMKIAKAGNIHNFCHPNSLLTLQEYLQDYGDEEAKALGAALIEKESDAGLSDSAKRMLARKMTKVRAGEHDVYI